MATRKRSPRRKAQPEHQCGTCRGLSPTELWHYRTNEEAKAVRRQLADPSCDLFEPKLRARA
jgi:hypothetical protein